MIKSLALAAMLYTPQVDSVDTEFNRAEIYIGNFDTLIKQVKEL